MNMNLLSFLSNYDDDYKSNDKTNQFLKAVNDAREEWISAMNFFENVTEPDLIDYAIYKIEASRRKYMYLIKQAKISGIEDRHVLKNMNGFS